MTPSFKAWRFVNIVNKRALTLNNRVDGYVQSERALIWGLFPQARVGSIMGTIFILFSLASIDTSHPPEQNTPPLVDGGIIMSTTGRPSSRNETAPADGCIPDFPRQTAAAKLSDSQLYPAPLSRFRGSIIPQPNEYGSSTLHVGICEKQMGRGGEQKREWACGFGG